jgi:2'-5' RNA ligase
MGKHEKEPAMRLFFALWPAEAERSALAAWQAPLHELCAGRVMQPATLHTTLVFLGQVAAHRLDTAHQAARETAFHAFALEFTAAHYWRHNHIVYAAPASVPEPLQQLVAELERNLLAQGFRFERRPYRPHVTLLRNATWDGAVLPPVPAVRWQVGEFALVRSHSAVQSARYEVLARFPRQAV